MKRLPLLASLYLFTILSMASFAAIQVEIRNDDAQMTESTVTVAPREVQKFYEAVNRRDEAVRKAEADLRSVVNKKPEPIDGDLSEGIELGKAKASAARKARNDAREAAERDLKDPQDAFVELITKQVKGMGTELKPIVSEHKGTFSIRYDKLDGEPRPTVMVHLTLVPPSADGKTPADLKSRVELSNTKRK
jgi:hypothetical protein